jgi:hypothetical protein
MRVRPDLDAYDERVRSGEAVAGDFALDQYLARQALIHRVAQALAAAIRDGHRPGVPTGATPTVWSVAPGALARRASSRTRPNDRAT